MHSEALQGQTAAQNEEVFRMVRCLHSTTAATPITSSIWDVVLLGSHRPPAPPSTRETSRRFFRAPRPPPRWAAALPCDGRPDIPLRARPERLRHSGHGFSAPVRPQDLHGSMCGDTFTGEENVLVGEWSGSKCIPPNLGTPFLTFSYPH